MKARHVYLANDLPAARQAMSIARSSGIADSDIGLIARSDIEEFKIHDRRKEADSDLIPALKRGLLLGAAAGIVVAVLMGLTWEVGASWPMIILGGAVGGAMVGGLGSMLTGASMPIQSARNMQRKSTPAKFSSSSTVSGMTWFVSQPKWMRTVCVSCPMRRFPSRRDAYAAIVRSTAAE